MELELKNDLEAKPADLEVKRSNVLKKFDLTKYMTIEEVMAYANCSKRYIQNEIKRKNLKGYKIKGLFFDPKDVELWIKRKMLRAS